MTGMSVYGIVSAHFDNNLMTKLVVGPFNSGEMLARVERNRDWLLEKLRDGLLSVYTVRRKNGRWELANKINVMIVNGQKFLRIDTQTVAGDFLGETSQF